MATQLIDFSIVRDFIYNGVNQGYSCINLNGTRLWEHYQIEEVYQEWYINSQDIAHSTLMDANQNYNTSIKGPFLFTGGHNVIISDITGDQYQQNGEYHLNVGVEYSWDGINYTNNYNNVGRNGWFWGAGHSRSRYAYQADMTLVLPAGATQIWIKLVSQGERGSIKTSATVNVTLYSGHEEDIYQWQGYQALAHGSSTFLIGPYGYDSEGYINSFAVINWFPTVTSGWVATGQYRLTGHSGNYYGRIREGAERRLSQTQWVDTSIYVDKTKLTDMWYY